MNTNRHIIELKESNLQVYPSWEKIFGREAPLYLEIGIGNGEFIVWLAKNHPEANFIGVEVAKEFFRKALNRVVSANLSNVRLICMEGSKALCKLFFSQSLSGLYLNFPDPWAKKKQKKRRLINQAFVWLLADRLILNGFFIMVTDYKEYAEEVVNFFLNCPSFCPLWDSVIKNSLPHYYHTKYARKWLSAGLPLFYIGFKKIKHISIPEWVYTLYPLAKLKGGETLPESVIKINNKLNFFEIAKKFPTGVIWKNNHEICKIVEIYFNENNIILDLIVIEGFLKQRFFVSIHPHSDGLIIKIHDSDNPDATDGVHKALAFLTLYLQKILKSGILLRTNCKSKAFKEIKKLFPNLSDACNN
ncbi:tRNA (guanosine(46)-N7)-methyltransferase TrmB [Candidatus Pacearchaeota archaeon]|nr:MAG: tRNA (guanosine(46)-N7)-methyltransferase TrmB [Candidatus Pacearchaeota archaeon]